LSTLVVAPHMDDEVLGCGGILQRLSQPVVVFLTQKAWDVRLTPAGRVPYAGEERKREMAIVAGALGFEYVTFEYPVHELDLVATGELVGALERVMSGLDVDTILAPAVSHDADHEATRKAVRSLMRPHCFAGTMLEYMTWGIPGPYDDALVLPLTEQEMKLKMKCMQMYATQIAPAGVRDDLYAYSVESVEAHAIAAGRLVHARYAECFVPRRIVGWPTR
jgi:LmbE family N-acetylglucosaminyl deacetylase